MRKSQLIESLAGRFDGNRRAASQALDAVLDTITREIARGEKVAIKGFGTFERVLPKKPGSGFVPSFVPGKSLASAVSGRLRAGKPVAPGAPVETTVAEPAVDEAPAEEPAAKPAAEPAVDERPDEQPATEQAAPEPVAVPEMPAAEAAEATVGSAIGTPAEPVAEPVAQPDPGARTDAPAEPVATEPLKKAPVAEAPAEKVPAAKKTAAKKTTAKKAPAKKSAGAPAKSSTT
ncbi:MAG: HU family DNA-binding protein, partial [Nocardioides sp.]|nr:HU family DNA-binding protein [Nocardioides sp.]